MNKFVKLSSALNKLDKARAAINELHVSTNTSMTNTTLASTEKAIEVTMIQVLAGFTNILEKDFGHR